MSDDTPATVTLNLRPTAVALLYLLLTRTAAGLPISAKLEAATEGLLYDVTLDLKGKDFDMPAHLEALQFALGHTPLEGEAPSQRQDN